MDKRIYGLLGNRWRVGSPLIQLSNHPLIQPYSLIYLQSKSGAKGGLLDKWIIGWVDWGKDDRADEVR